MKKKIRELKSFKDKPLSAYATEFEKIIRMARSLDENELSNINPEKSLEELIFMKVLEK